VNYRHPAIWMASGGGAQHFGGYLRGRYRLPTLSTAPASVLQQGAAGWWTVGGALPYHWNGVSGAGSGGQLAGRRSAGSNGTSSIYGFNYRSAKRRQHGFGGGEEVLAVVGFLSKVVK
jgi:hypothetical protein